MLAIVLMTKPTPTDTQLTMKISIKRDEAKMAAGKAFWRLSVWSAGKRYRKFFKTHREAHNFDTLTWLSNMARLEPRGPDTMVSAAVAEYLQEYKEVNMNPAKPEPKGLMTTRDRVFKWLWYLDSRSVVFCRDVATAHLIDYITSGKCQCGPRRGMPWCEESRKAYAAAAMTFMRWCAEKGYGVTKGEWFVQTTTSSLTWRKQKTFDSSPGICSPEETANLLNFIHEQYRPALAIMFFTGIRPEVEMSLLRYSDISWGESIKLEAMRTKTEKERVLFDLPENLWKWVPKRKTGKVMPSYGALNQARRRAARRAGFNYPADGARHSFGSYGFWLGVEWAIDTMGHSNTSTFFKNYKNNKTNKGLAKEYFSI